MARCNEWKKIYFIGLLFTIISCQSGGVENADDSRQQCERGNAEACFQLSKTITVPEKSPDNKDSEEYERYMVKKQVKNGLLEKACALWHSDGCIAWGDNLAAAAENISSESDRRERFGSALEAYMKPCRTGYAIGCMKVADLFDSGKTPTHWTKRGNDSERAKLYYKKACVLGATEACSKTDDK